MRVTLSEEVLVSFVKGRRQERLYDYRVIEQWWAALKILIVSLNPAFNRLLQEYII